MSDEFSISIDAPGLSADVEIIDEQDWQLAERLLEESKARKKLMDQLQQSQEDIDQGRTVSLTDLKQKLAESEKATTDREGGTSD